jgi:hypothetical protein
VVLTEQQHGKNRGEQSNRVWAEILRQLNAAVAEWNPKFLPSDGRRIILDEISGRTLTLTSRSVAIAATMSEDGKVIEIVGRHQSDIGHASRESVQVHVHQEGYIELQHAGSKLNPRQLAQMLVENTSGNDVRP